MIPGRPETAGVLIETIDIDVLARTLWGEARGEGDEGAAAVAWVVRNRAEWSPPAWWGRTVTAVCQHPWQFSCWNEDDPNRRKLERLTSADADYQRLYDIACRALLAPAGDDPTGGGTHYHVAAMQPRWAVGKTPTATIGKHRFYRLGPKA